MGRFFLFLLAFCALALGLGLWMTRATPLPAGTMAGLTGDPVNGRDVFLAGGCVSCHGEAGSAHVLSPVLAGGTRLATPFGTFVAPNISPDPTAGIGRYDLDGFAGVMLRGVTPEGRHVYPAMPYPSYVRMTLQDIADLKAYLDTLPASATPNAPNDLRFPYSIRRAVGLWKIANLDPSFVAAAPSPQMERGRYLVEALGHCADCHTPRTRFGGLDRSRWMAGVPAVSGRSAVPNITPAALDWSQREIVYYLESGFNPDHEEVGRDMDDVIAGLSQLPDEDRQAIAAYLRGLAPLQ
ncbi:cytochrome c [Tropicimonas sp. IMCC34043]|uniref:cytochrome c n=1 Tax=Tropicimonas sp. IMCC34043 TaxID=2248760 RepID=UPI000E24F8F8|nr:cytochrome c [Tropicimonas sp. IMCC34043]